MAKLSEQLADLSNRAKEIKERVAAAQKEGKAKIEAQAATLKTKAQAKQAELKAKFESMKDRVEVKEAQGQAYHAENNAERDVIIIGYGPVGATLAAFLGQQKWRVTVIEREMNIYRHPRALHLDDEGVRIYQTLGELPAMRGKVFTPMSELEYLTSDGKVLLSLPADEKKSYGFANHNVFLQPALETLLREKNKKLASVERLLGHELVSFSQTDDLVTATIRDVVSGEEKTISASYLIGCDGGRSTTREQLGVKLKSFDFDESWLVVDVFLKDGVDNEMAGLSAKHRQYCDPKQPMTYVNGVGNHRRWEFMQVDGKTKEVGLPKVKELLATQVDLDLIEIGRHAVYTFHGLLAETWRQGRVLLAGDAAHMMPPFGGQGMCSGSRDAHNLSFKLDLVLRGEAKVALLDTYQEERKPHVDAIIKGSIAAGKIVQSRNPIMLFGKALLQSKNMMKTLEQKPRLKEGLLYPSSNSGAQMIQPLVKNILGEEVLLDDVLGTGFALLGRVEARLSTENQAAASRLPIRCVTLGTDFTDQTNTLQAWLDQAKANFILIRPDRYIFGSSTDANELVQALRSQL
jgi:3-(3-hydroxy-phenyl)propionate hydroxylase